MVVVEQTSLADGAWIDVNGGEVCIYSDKKAHAMVVGSYLHKNKEPIDKALVFNKDGSVVLQRYEDGQYTFTKLDPEMVARDIIHLLEVVDNAAIVSE